MDLLYFLDNTLFTIGLVLISWILWSSYTGVYKFTRIFRIIFDFMERNISAMESKMPPLVAWILFLIVIFVCWIILLLITVYIAPLIPIFYPLIIITPILSIIVFFWLWCRNPITEKCMPFLSQLIEPILAPIRKCIKPFFSIIDISPLVLLMLIGAVQSIIQRLLQ